VGVVLLVLVLLLVLVVVVVVVVVPACLGRRSPLAPCKHFQREVGNEQTANCGCWAVLQRASEIENWMACVLCIKRRKAAGLPSPI